MGTVVEKDITPSEESPGPTLGERIRSAASPASSPVLSALAIVLIANVAGANPWLLFGAAVIVYTGKLTNWTINIRRR